MTPTAKLMTGVILLTMPSILYFGIRADNKLIVNIFI